MPHSSPLLMLQYFARCWLLQTPLFDYHFDAMNLFRFFGYVLHEVAGVTCAALWDPDNPREWKFGYYEDILCQYWPEGTADGHNYWGK